MLTFREESEGPWERGIYLAVYMSGVFLLHELLYSFRALEVDKILLDFIKLGKNLIPILAHFDVLFSL